MTPTKKTGTAGAGEAAACPVDVAAAGAVRDLVHVDHGEPLTTSRRVALRFGKRHRDVLRSIQRLIAEAGPAFTERSFALSEYADPTGRTLPEYHLTQAGFMLLAMGFTGPDATALKVQFINAFDTMARELQRLKAQRLAPEWQAARAAVARQHSSVNAVLFEVRKAAGKDTHAHHLANEARLIGHALTGVHAGIDRDTLDADQLRLLHKVEARAVILIARGADYETRKAELRALVLKELRDCAPTPAPEPAALLPDTRTDPAR